MTALQPFVKLAIIGSGPSAFYAATRALTAAASNTTTPTTVHIYESLPTPFGLVRAGVAPDHPDVKNVTHRFTEVVREAAKRNAFRFFGNIKVVAGPSSASSSGIGTGGGEGKGTAVELPLEELIRHYTHIVLAYGSAQARGLGKSVSGQELRGVCSALDFVNWYNGHPDAHARTSNDGSVATPWLDVIRPGAHHVSVVGAGNVALDVARIILRARPPTSFFLASTDIPSSVLHSHLGKASINQVEHVSIVARRGVAQVAFTNKEIREMLTLGETEGVDFMPLSKEIGELALEDVARLKHVSDQAAADVKQGQFGSLGAEAFKAHASELAGELRIRKRLVDLLIKGSKKPKASAFGHRKSWSLEPFRAPEAILPSSSSSSSSHVGHIRWSVTEPVPHPPSESDPSASPSPAPTSASQNPTWGGGVSPAASPQSPPQWGATRATGQSVTTNTDAVIYSLGYVGARLPPPATAASDSNAWQQLVPFDEQRQVVKNEKGLILWDAKAAAQLGLEGNKLPQLYATGWIGRGPVGVIASTMYDAYDVVDLMLSRTPSSPASPTPQQEQPNAIPSLVQESLLSDKDALKPKKEEGSGALEVDGVAGLVTEWEDWEVLDEAERKAGAAHQPTPKEREKVISFR